MTECIAMAVGVILGGACAIFAQMQNAKCKMKKEKGDSSAEESEFRVMNPAERDVMMQPETAVADAEREKLQKLQKQWENFMNYSGDSDGQVEVNEE